MERERVQASHEGIGDLDIIRDLSNAFTGWERISSEFPRDRGKNLITIIFDNKPKIQTNDVT